MLEIYIIRIISNIKFKKLVRKQLEILHMQQIFSVYFNLKSYWLSNSIDKSNCERKEAQVVNLIERRQNCNLYKYLKKDGCISNWLILATWHLRGWSSTWDVFLDRTRFRIQTGFFFSPSDSKVPGPGRFYTYETNIILSNVQ